jgi:hypothetical protein
MSLILYEYMFIWFMIVVRMIMSLSTSPITVLLVRFNISISTSIYEYFRLGLVAFPDSVVRFPFLEFPYLIFAFIALCQRIKQNNYRNAYAKEIQRGR